MAASGALSITIADEVTDELYAAYVHLLPQLTSSSAPDRQRLEGVVESPATKLFVATNATGIVGLLTLASFPIPTGQRCWIEDVVVDEQSRGSGAGTALIMAALDAARADGAKVVDLTSRPSRQSANRLYVRIGFELRETNVYRIDLHRPEGHL